MDPKIKAIKYAQEFEKLKKDIRNNYESIMYYNKNPTFYMFDWFNNYKINKTKKKIIKFRKMYDQLVLFYDACVTFDTTDYTDTMWTCHDSKMEIDDTYDMLMTLDNKTKMISGTSSDIF